MVPAISATVTIGNATLGRGPLSDQRVVRPLRGQDAAPMEDGVDAGVNYRFVVRSEIVVPVLGLGLLLLPRRPPRRQARA